MKTVYIIGINGNMARRYKAILDYLGVDVYGHDIEFADTAMMYKADGFILATPTHTHVKELLKLLKYDKPILCEKPISKSIDELSFLREKGDLITMVDQYNFLINRNSSGPSYYSYFKSGGDGLKWDCINIIGHSEEKPILGTSAPVWSCDINGHELDISGMDEAYIDMIQSWLSGEPSNFEYAVEAHKKVLEWFPNEH